MQIGNSPTRLSATVSAAVRAEMARRRVSQQKLASHLGWSQPKISRRLNDVVPFALDDLTAIAGALGVTVDDLLRPAHTMADVQAAAA